jgi:amidase
MNSEQSGQEVPGAPLPLLGSCCLVRALANFAYLPATARPITCASAGLPMGIQIVGPYLEDRTPIHAALLMDDLFGGFVRPS